MNDPCMHAFSAKIVVRMGFFYAKNSKNKKRILPKWMVLGCVRKKSIENAKSASNKKLCKRQYHAKVYIGIFERKWKPAS